MFLVRKKIVRQSIFLNISRGFKREIVASDFDPNHRPKLKSVDEILEDVKEEKYDIENEKWCDNDVFNDRED
tara:strand:- start:173 stop:388 length:216 start_codon:yes stop_codon:yes gene_type:complete